MFKQFVCILGMLAAAGAARAGNDELRMIAPLNQAMPLASFKDDKLSGGILKDLGEAIAPRSGRRAVVTAVDGDPVSAALRSSCSSGPATRSGCRTRAAAAVRACPRGCSTALVPSASSLSRRRSLRWKST